MKQIIEDLMIIRQGSTGINYYGWRDENQYLYNAMTERKQYSPVAQGLLF